MLYAHRTHAIAVLLACVAAAACGCQAPDVANPFEIGPEEYHAVYEASIETLRDYRFAVDRQDRRFGVVTTRARTAASVFEPWHPDNTRPHQVAQNTLNHQRRHVRVEIYRADMPPDQLDEDAAEADAPPPADDTANAAPPDPDALTPAEPIELGDGYMLLVRVFLERRQHPPRVLNSAVFTEVDLRRRPRMHQPVVTEEGVIESHWRPVGRDPYLERRLIADIIRRSIEIDPIYEATTTAER